MSALAQRSAVRRRSRAGRPSGHRATGAGLPIQLTRTERRLLRAIGEDAAAIEEFAYRHDLPDPLDALEAVAAEADLYALILRAGREGVLPLRRTADVVAVVKRWATSAGDEVTDWEARAIRSLLAAFPAGVVA